MLRSMTGFGRGEVREEGTEILVEIKTVNHRYCDIYLKMPRQLSSLEDRVRETVGKALSRGKIDIYVSYEDFSGEASSVMLDEGLAKAYIQALELLRDKFELKDDISTSLVSRFPEVLKAEKKQADEEKTWRILSEALDKSLESVILMRENEGEELKRSLLEKAALIEEVLNEIRLRAPCVVKEYKQRLEARIKELLEQQVMDENRLAAEVAIFADRCSIDEELVRMASHVVQLRDTLQMGGPVGRKLDFLVQEMNREINTIGSKANDIIITRNVLELKSEIEKMREQIQNIE